MITNLYNFEINDDLSNVLHDDNEWIVDYNKPIGKGQLSVGVFIGEKVSGQIDGKAVPKQIAIKLIENAHIGKHEFKVLYKLKDISSHHQNIAKIYGYALGPLKKEQQPTNSNSNLSRGLYIYMEYMEGYVDLLEYVKQNKQALDEDKIRNITIQLIDTLAELNEVHHIIHRDIKSSNIMYNPVNGNIKLIDFGVSKSWDNTSQYGTVVGSNYYTAPEVTNKSGNASSRSDIWSVGCTLIQLAGGDLAARKDTVFKDNKIPVIPSDLSNEFKNFIQHCLIVDPADRPKAKDLKNHPFLKGEKIEGTTSTYLNSSNIISVPVNYIEVKLNDLPASEADVYIRNRLNQLQSTTHLKIIEFKYDNDISTIALFENIPTTTTHLILQDFNQELSLIKSLPSTIVSLSLPAYNQPIPIDSIPSNIKSLSMLSFNQDIEDIDTIPSTIEELVLGESFDFFEYSGNLPGTIKSFTCSYNFNKPIRPNSALPDEASRLVLDNYNQKVSKVFPLGIHTLTLGSNYKEQQDLSSLSNLPPSVFNLTFGVSSECTLNDQDIKKLLPSTITNLIIKRVESKSQQNITNSTI